jgi:uncharacterized protein YjbI with pentapeptide repeats
VRLRADCGQCFGLCCVVPTFCAAADFAITKPAGRACPHLETNARCGIHDNLLQRGFAGCVAYDCLGAGQRLCRVTGAGPDWTRKNQLTSTIQGAFPVLVRLHQLLWYLTQALALPAALPIRPEIRQLLDDIEELASGDPAALAGLDVHASFGGAPALLRQASALARPAASRRPDLRDADLIGKKLSSRNLTEADLSGALLIGADLTRADLTRADLLGADFRGANLSGANLTGALFVAPTQLWGARGDLATVLPPGLNRPAHWNAPGDR